jgi:hypothetical protein
MLKLVQLELAPDGSQIQCLAASHAFGTAGAVA